MSLQRALHLPTVGSVQMRMPAEALVNRLADFSDEVRKAALEARHSETQIVGDCHNLRCPFWLFW